MSILKSTNSGREHLPLTPEVASSLGWHADYDITRHKYKDGIETEFTVRIVHMRRNDFYMPLHFTYDSEKDSIEICVTFSFKGGEERFGFTRDSSKERLIKTTGELTRCLNFMKLVYLYEDKLKDYWDANLSDLQDPNKKYYTK